MRGCRGGQACAGAFSLYPGDLMYVGHLGTTERLMPWRGLCDLHSQQEEKPWGSRGSTKAVGGRGQGEGA